PTCKRHKKGSHPFGRHDSRGDPGTGRSLLPSNLERVFEGAEICARSTCGGWIAKSHQWKGNRAINAPRPARKGPAVPHHERKLSALLKIGSHPALEEGMAERRSTYRLGKTARGFLYH